MSTCTIIVCNTYKANTCENERRNGEARIDIALQSAKTACDEMLKQVNLYKVRNKKVKAFSMGMKQRLSIAMALIDLISNSIKYTCGDIYFKLAEAMGGSIYAKMDKNYLNIYLKLNKFKNAD